MLLCIHNQRKVKTNMNDMKIYRDGKYDIKANIALKIRIKAPIILQKLDDGFNKLYEY